MRRQGSWKAPDEGAKRMSRAGRWAALVAWCATLLGAALLGAPRAEAVTTPLLLDSLQHGAFDYFWNEANPSNGLVRDRSTPGSPASIAAMGFGFSAICIGIDHGWVTRDAGRARILTTLQTLWNQPQGAGSSGFIGYHGLYYHFLDMGTATRTWTSELSTIDTALLFAGIIDAKHYFATSDPLDVQVRTLADSILHRADWPFMYNGIGIAMAWSPESGRQGTWVGYNEATILYLLALGSPTHPVSSSSWFTWTSGYDWLTYYGYTYVNFPPLFGHQYSHCWVDFRSIQDLYMRSKGITYFENSRRATLAQREYCIQNPGGYVGYGPNLWGLTASDDPGGYVAHGAPPAQSDNGTITPTAPASSIAFAPEVVIPTLHNMYDLYYAQLWGPYGFRDAFNLTAAWWDTDYLGIDEGPIIVMIENYLTQSVWTRVMQDADIQAGLTAAGFGPATSVDLTASPGRSRLELAQNAPNPFRGTTTVAYRLPAAGNVELVLYDVLGRAVRTVVRGDQSAGFHQVSLGGEGLPSGVYFYRLRSGGEVAEQRCILIK
ncbi:MAG: glucoamylase family protein [bacterium]